MPKLSNPWKGIYSEARQRLSLIHVRKMLRFSDEVVHRVMVTLPTRILDLISKRCRGKVFASKDFLDLGSRQAVDQALSRLARAGTIRRVGRGLYYSPRINQTLGIELPPDPDEVALALARRTGSRIVPSGAVAANALGLSTQVPAKPVYLTDGRSRQVRVGNTVFTVRHAAPKDLPIGSPLSAMVIQALRFFGRDGLSAEIVSRLRRRLSPQERRRLLEDARYTTAWIADVARQVAADESQETIAHG
jgi:hypothetical protein